MLKAICSFFFILSLYAIEASTLNAIALKNGCRLVQKPSAFYKTSSYSAKIEDWTILGIMDQNASIGWCSGPASKAPYVFVFELSEEYFIDKIHFNNNCPKQYPGICSKDVAVEYSVTSASSGFALLNNYTLQEFSDVTMDLSRVKARWIRLTVLSNYGNSQWTELMEFEAWGEFAGPAAGITDIDGVWSSNYDWVSFKKNAQGYQYGCYKWAQGEFFNAKNKRRVCTFDWKQKGDGQTGWCVLVVNKEGTHISGTWGIGKDTTTFGFWEFTKTQNSPYVCPNDEEVKAFPNGMQHKPAAKEVLIEVVIDVMDLQTQKHIAGNIELFTEKRYYTIPSGDGLYTANIVQSSFVVIKTNLLNYFPTIDTISLNTETEQTYLSLAVYVTKLAIGNNLILKNILFNKGSYALLPESGPELEIILTTLNQYPEMEIELSGHTDNLGDAKKNVELSEQRVMAVKQYLVKKGIASSRIQGVGYGGRYPIASNAGENTRKLNRRVELKIIKM
ncbi:MAG: OmpA family protein [Cytophagales bacterium]|nr:OmpA family protein [Cytophaga sp.]